MATKKEEARNAALEAQRNDDNALPTYSATPPSQGPTIASPFDFPSNEPPPSSSASASASGSGSAPAQLKLPIAVPQVTPDKTGAFLNAYAQPLLRYGVTPETWRAFLATCSAFLAAKVSEQAIAHAADIGRHVTNVPKHFGEGIIGQAKSIGHNISDSGKRGNYLGAAMGVVGGTLALTVGIAVGASSALIRLPVTAISAAARKPQTPKERAAAYVSAANEKWLGMRGLRVQLMDTPELARVVGLSTTGLLDLARTSEDRSAAGQINSLKEHISELEIFTESTLELETHTLWLVVFQEVSAGNQK